MTAPATPRRDGPLTEAGRGFAALGAGLAHLLKHPRLFLLGMLPCLISLAICAAALAGVVAAAGPVGRWAARPVAGWGDVATQVTAAIVGFVLVLAAGFLLVLLFSSLTLVVGGPCYERLSLAVDRDRGWRGTEPREPLRAMLARIVADSLRSLWLGVLVGVAVFAVGLIPVLGQVVGVVAGACAGGWLVTLELTEPACTRRGLVRLADRRRLLRGRRARYLGFGAPVYLCLAVPVLNVVAFPVAVAGATVLAGELAREGEAR